MVDLELLAKTVEDHGVTINWLCNKANIKRGTWYSRINGVGDFTAPEIEGIVAALRLTNKQRDEIFFAKR